MRVDDRRKYLLRKIKEIHEFRNRVAHHEPLCLVKIPSSSSPSRVYTEISIDKAREVYDAIRELITYMDIQSNKLFHYTQEDILNTLSLLRNFNKDNSRIFKKKLQKKLNHKK